VAAELKALWVVRMKGILARLPQRRVLLWTANHPPPEGLQGPEVEPMFVDRAMIDALRPHVSAVVEHVASPVALAEGVQSMRFTPAEEHAAQELPGPAIHREAAEALLPVLEGLL
jgi:hypothetical protein